MLFDEVTAPLFTTEWGRRLGLGLCLAFAIFILIALIQVFLTWRDDFSLVTSHSTMPSAQTNNETLQMIAQIPQWHLFGQHQVLENSSILPVTSLQIRLVGVIKSIPEKNSRVIISESGQPGKLYKVGDVLPTTGVEVYAITGMGVILDNSGRLEKLPLQRSQLLFQGKPKPLLADSGE